MPNDARNADVPATRIRRNDWRWCVLYCLLALLIQWPMLDVITTHISYGQETEATVPLLNLWTVWWNADRLWHGFRGYWNSPIFYPTEKTFVFSEAQPISIIVAPVLWLTGNRVLTYNIYQLLILALNGYSAHCLFRRLGHLPWLAFCGGVMSQTLPFVIWQFGVVQLTTLFGIYWTIHAVLDLLQIACAEPPEISTNEINGTIQRPRFSGLRLGTAFGLTYLACNYWGLFLTLLLIPCSICLWNRRLMDVSFWKDILLAGTVALLLIGPFAWLQKSLAYQHGWQISRTDEMIYGLSARCRDHTDVPWETWTAWLEFPEEKRTNIWALGGGGLKLLLIPAGCIATWAHLRRRRWGVFALMFGGLAFGLSLGPTVRFAEGIPLIGQVNPYRVLQDYVPGFSLIRSPFRFAVFVQLVAVWLSLEALDLLNPLRWTTSRKWTTSQSPDVDLTGTRWLIHWSKALTHREGWKSIASWIPLVAASTIITLEVVPPIARMYSLPTREGLPIWVMWLRDSADANASVACLPFPRGNQVYDYEETTLWMYWGTFHSRPLWNGYSGFFPKTYNDLRDALDIYQMPAKQKPNETFVPHFRDYHWDSPGLRRLNECGVRYVVMKRSFGTRDDVLTHAQTRFRWALVVSDEAAEVDIYELPTLDN